MKATRDYAWPRALAGCFERNGLWVTIIAALSVAAFIAGFVCVARSRRAVRRPCGGDFYRLMPHSAMVALFGGVTLYAMLAITMSVRAFWRDIPARAGTGLASRRRSRDACSAALSRTAAAAAARARTRGRRRTAPPLSSLHVLRLSAVLRLHLRRHALSLRAWLAGAVSAGEHPGRAGHARRHRPDRSVPSGFCALKRRRDPILDDQRRDGHGHGVSRDAVSHQRHRSSLCLRCATRRPWACCSRSSGRRAWRCS